jgi:ribonuclease HI
MSHFKTSNNILNDFDTIIFTDGSKKDDGAGLGVVIKEEEITLCYGKRVNKEATVLQTELLAIQEAVSNCNAKKGLIVTDSKSAIKALSQRKSKSCTVQKVWKAMKQKQTKFELMWVKGHGNNQGNNKADEMAKKARINTDQEIVKVPLIKKEIKKKIENSINNKWRAQWKNLDTCLKTKQIIKYPTMSKRMRSLLLKKKNLKEICEWITGHGPFRAHAFKMGKSSSKICRLCGTKEERNTHILLECKSTEILRKRLSQEYKILCHNNNSWEFSKDILDEEKLYYIEEFIKHFGPLLKWEIRIGNDV